MVNGEDVLIAGIFIIMATVLVAVCVAVVEEVKGKTLTTSETIMITIGGGISGVIAVISFVFALVVLKDGF